ncbi:MAG: phosphopantetheine-binding protein [Actinobacteria bacterium]|nr:phosphopantetheine-binding protein [Actinomycetota bacterium]MCL5445184.1 phosphopantetheine-binding protein [Actinomycetota bacterium]
MSDIHTTASDPPTAGVSTLDVLAAVLVEVVGDDLLVDTEITLDTSFNDDLELESIEFVALSEKLQVHFGDRVDFVSWIGDMELEEIIGLKVGQLVSYIDECTR